MNAIPAKVAGVPRLVMVVPTPGGEVNPAVLAAAHLAGVSEVYRIGGAQARCGACLWHADHRARGQDRWPRQRLRGGGQAPGIWLGWHRHDCRAVRGRRGRGQGANPEWLAADLLAQAEHDEAAQSILIADDAALADATALAVEKQIATMARRCHRRQELGRSMARSFSFPICWKRRRPWSTRWHRSIWSCLRCGRGDDPQHPQCGRDLRRPSHRPRLWRLYGRLQPCAAHGPRRALRFRPWRSRFHEAYIHSGNSTRQALRALGAATMTLAEAEGLGGHRHSVAVRLRGAV